MIYHRVLFAALASSVVLPAIAHADENGVSFWLPGQYGSFASVPGNQGLSWTTIYYHGSVGAGNGQEFPHGGQVDVGLNGQANLAIFGPSYTFDMPVSGAPQLTLSLLTAGGHSEVGVDTVLSGPGGIPVSGSRTDTVTGFGDLYPTATLKWNAGVNNYMTYLAGDIPVGSYDPDRLANLGLGHAAIDVGGGYTYFNPTSGREASAVVGFTYNFNNPYTDYQSGIDMHIDWAAAQFVTKQFFVGAGGYYYQQLTGDSGSGAVLGDFKSRVLGVGPQVGYFFPVSDKVQGVFNAKANWEFDPENRASGWNLWIGFALSPAAPKKT